MLKCLSKNYVIDQLLYVLPTKLNDIEINLQNKIYKQNIHKFLILTRTVPRKVIYKMCSMYEISLFFFLK